MNDVDVNEALGNYSYDDDDEDIKDTYECGRCEAKFQSLDRFMNHKMSCKVKKNGKKVTKSDVDSEDLTSQFRCTLSTDDEHVMNDIQKMIKENTDKFTTTNMGNDFYEKGSLVIWGKMNTSATKNRESVKKCMEVFVVNMLENCQINSEKETKVTVKLDILKEIEGCEDDDEDVFCCGRCNKLFNRIDTFSSHKKDCNRRARLLRTIRQKTLLLGEIPRTVEAQCNLSEQTTGLQTDTNVVVEMFGDTESKPEVTETAVETDTNVLVEKLGAVRMESEVVATQSNVFESKGMEEQSRDTAPVEIQMIDKPKDIVVLGTKREVKDFIFRLQKNTEKFDYIAGLYANDENTQLDTLLVTYQFIFILYTENFDMKKAGLTEEDVNKIRRIDNYPQIKIVCNCERRLVNEAISRIDLDFKNERWDDFLKEDSKYLDILKQLRMLHLKKNRKET